LGSVLAQVGEVSGQRLHHARFGLLAAPTRTVSDPLPATVSTLVPSALRQIS